MSRQGAQSGDCGGGPPPFRRGGATTVPTRGSGRRPLWRGVRGLEAEEVSELAIVEVRDPTFAGLHRDVAEVLTLGHDLSKPLLEGALGHQAMHEDSPGLADAVGPICCLILLCRIVAPVEVNHVSGCRQSDAHTAGHDAQQHHGILLASLKVVDRLLPRLTVHGPDEHQRHAVEVRTDLLVQDFDGLDVLAEDDGLLAVGDDAAEDVLEHHALAARLHGGALRPAVLRHRHRPPHGLQVGWVVANLSQGMHHRQHPAPPREGRLGGVLPSCPVGHACELALLHRLVQ
mmetsp:Transcript_579/g.2427  ORF Transcript_579/g.2427 Transcript_579/m.2427 type:complete len:288 (+) Transcript_579:147-1010(+)